LEETIGMSSIMHFFMSLVLLVLIVVKDPSVLNGGCSGIALFVGLPAAAAVAVAGGGITMF
jgi:uncharacterized membrane protein YqjE